MLTCWRKACNTYLKKGGQVYVEGRFIVDPATGGPRLWTRQDGSPVASFEVHADLVRFLGGKNGDGNGYAVPAEAIASIDSEIPFQPPKNQCRPSRSGTGILYQKNIAIILFTTSHLLGATGRN